MLAEFKQIPKQCIISYASGKTQILKPNVEFMHI